MVRTVRAARATLTPRARPDAWWEISLVGGLVSSYELTIDVLVNYRPISTNKHYDIENGNRQRLFERLAVLSWLIVKWPISHNQRRRCERL